MQFLAPQQVRRLHIRQRVEHRVVFVGNGVDCGLFLVTREDAGTIMLCRPSPPVGEAVDPNVLRSGSLDPRWFR